MQIDFLNEKLNIEEDLKIEENLIKFNKIFQEYNAHTNLVSENDAKFLFEKHIFDSLALNLFLCKNSLGLEEHKLLDIGSGGGFPAIPIAIAFENIEVLAIDSKFRKIEFINKVKTELKLQNLKARCVRAEDFGSDIRNYFDISTSRAVAKLGVILEYAIPYTKVGGHFIAYKSIGADLEIKYAKNALKKLNSEIVDVIKYDLPTKENHKRVLIVVKKLAEVPLSYPRSAQKIRFSPL